MYRESRVRRLVLQSTVVGQGEGGSQALRWVVFCDKFVANAVRARHGESG